MVLVLALMILVVIIIMEGLDYVKINNGYLTRVPQEEEVVW